MVALGEPQRFYPNPTTYEFLVGGFAASLMSLSYFIIPFWLGYSIFAVIFYPFSFFTWLIVTPIITSIVYPPQPSKTALQQWPFKYMPAYFDFEAVYEIDEKEIPKMMEERPNLVCVQPHGVFSYGGACAGVEASKTWMNPKTLPTAVATVVKYVPIVKHVVGLFGIVDASSKSLKKHLRTKSVVLYIGGIAELFLCSSDEEKLFVKKRKGFIKLALETGADILPVYCFGNTTCFEVAKGDWLKNTARSLGMSLTVFWGVCYLPIPMPVKVVTVVGKPLDLPRLSAEEITPEDIEKYHNLYISEVERIYNTYKHLAPLYKEKKLAFE